MRRLVPVIARRCSQAVSGRVGVAIGVVGGPAFRLNGARVGRYASACRRRSVVHRLPRSEASAEVASARTPTRQVADLRAVRRSRPARGEGLTLNLPNCLPAYPSIGVTRCLVEVLRRGILRDDPGSIGPRLCTILHANFREPNLLGGWVNRSYSPSVARVGLPVEQGGVDLMNARDASASLNKEHRSNISSER